MFSGRTLGTLSTGFALIALVSLGTLSGIIGEDTVLGPHVCAIGILFDSPDVSVGTVHTVLDFEGLLGAVLSYGHNNTCVCGIRFHAFKDSTGCYLAIDVLNSRLVDRHLLSELVDVIIVVLARREYTTRPYYKGGEQKPVDEFFVHTLID